MMLRFLFLVITHLANCFNIRIVSSYYGRSWKGFLDQFPDEKFNPRKYWDFSDFFPRKVYLGGSINVLLRQKIVDILGRKISRMVMFSFNGILLLASWSYRKYLFSNLRVEKIVQFFLVPSVILLY